jgi:type I restriction-modification system DNA methylase subunit
LDVFDRYNFTIKEDEPLDKEVAVDPEMLGKVFENMLDITERKSKGAFYTPREIVHYMCQESLIHYLDNA